MNERAGGLSRPSESVAEPSRVESDGVDSVERTAARWTGLLSYLRADLDQSGEPIECNCPQLSTAPHFGRGSALTKSRAVRRHADYGHRSGSPVRLLAQTGADSLTAAGLLGPLRRAHRDRLHLEQISALVGLS